MYSTTHLIDCKINVQCYVIQESVIVAFFKKRIAKFIIVSTPSARHVGFLRVALSRGCPALSFRSVLPL